jgi:long-chain acyl-CoA synthetase
MLVDAPGVDEMNLKSLQRILYGAAPISEMLLKRAIAVFGCAFNHAYGMTETAGTVVTLAPQDHDPGGPLAHRLRSCGRPVPWAELALINPATGAAVPTGEVGEIRIRSPMNMLGYWRKPAETAATITADGWLCTGDAAYRDADGFVYIHDRYKDMIVSGGENIYPTEIENVLYDHPGVAEVAVIGVPHARWGETPKAFVIARANAQLSEAQLIAFTRSRLASYKCPTSVAFVTALPRNASGKILKRAMRDESWLRERG